MSAATLIPAASAICFCAFALSVPKIVSSWNSTTLRTLCPVFTAISRKKSNIAWVNITSCGDVRKNHFSPR